MFYAIEVEVLISGYHVLALVLNFWNFIQLFLYVSCELVLIPESYFLDLYNLALYLSSLESMLEHE